MDTAIAKHWIAECQVGSDDELRILFIIAKECLDGMDARFNSVFLLIEDDENIVSNIKELHYEKVRYTRQLAPVFKEDRSVKCRIAIIRNS